ncbi:MAG: uroporphyrinogen-III C-methyltransferase [Betaproteobacteria bacterium]|nr:uroporphyrinogen-III C-methyltransferase [Betaproteobacteria bacterium]
MTDEAPRAETKPVGHARPPWWLIAIAVLALLLAATAWWQSRDAAGEIRQAIGNRLAESANTQQAEAIRLEQLQRDSRDLQNRLSQLESKLGEFQSQRLAIEEMYRDLARAPDDWLLAEIEQTLNIASRELTLAGNVRGALIALQAADTRLARADKLQVTGLRRALATDMDRLKALPLVDMQGVSLKLDTLMTLSATLPLAVADSMAANANREEEPPPPGGNLLARAGRDLWFEMRQLIRIRDMENSDVALLSPQQSYFVRENLKLRLLAARTSLIARDEVNYKEDLKLAQEMLMRYFDGKAKVNVNAQATLKQLAESPVSIATPDITASLNAIRAARAARERPSR